MRTAHLLAFSILVAAAPFAHAFLGDDEAAIKQRYGAPVRSSAASDGSLMVTYESAGYKVIVNFVNGRSDSEGFFRLGDEKGFPESTITAFLRAHAAGEVWHVQGDIEGRRNWVRSSACATYDASNVLGPELMIFTPASIKPKSSLVSLPVADVASAASPASTAVESRVLTVIQGTGDKTSDPFTITGGGGFTVWYKSAKYLGVNVYQLGGRKHLVADANLKAGGIDHTFVPAGPGTYCIEFTAVGDYAASVTQ